MEFLLAGGGLAALFGGGEMLVRGAVGIARRFDLSPLFIGVVVVGFGTSAPELVVCLDAALRGQDEITIGNIVGSNIANVLLILGLAAVLSPILTRNGAVRRDGLAMLTSAAVLVLLAFWGGIARPAGLAMLVALLCYLVYSVREERRTEGDASAERDEEVEQLGGGLNARLPLAVAAVLGGLVFLVLGSRLLIDGATVIARNLGLSEAVIGVTLVAVGTSLPELATTIVAALRRQGDVALGNVLGSNVFNVFGMLGVTALIAPLAIHPSFLDLDVWVMLASSALLLFLLWRVPRIGRMGGVAFLAIYVVYVGWLVTPGLA